MNATYKFNPETRKAMVKALAEILETKPKYLGMPSAAFQIGDYHLAKDGTLTGPALFGLLTALHERGFDREDDPAPEAEAAPEADPEFPTEPELDQIVIEPKFQKGNRKKAVRNREISRFLLDKGP